MAGGGPLPILYREVGGGKRTEGGKEGWQACYGITVPFFLFFFFPFLINISMRLLIFFQICNGEYTINGCIRGSRERKRNSGAVMMELIRFLLTLYFRLICIFIFLFFNL